MSRIWIGIILLLLFLGLGLWSSISMGTFHKPLAQEIRRAGELAATDLESAVKTARAAREKWDSHWGRTAMLADHTPMDEIDAQFELLEGYAAAGRSADFSAHCMRLSAMISATAEAHSFTLRNLL